MWNTSVMEISLIWRKKLSVDADIWSLCLWTSHMDVVYFCGERRLLMMWKHDLWPKGVQRMVDGEGRGREGGLVSWKCDGTSLAHTIFGYEAWTMRLQKQNMMHKLVTMTWKFTRNECKLYIKNNIPVIAIKYREALPILFSQPGLLFKSRRK